MLVVGTVLIFAAIGAMMMALGLVQPTAVPKVVGRRTASSQARNAAMRIVARSFAMPLRAAGIDASVTVRFMDPAGREEASYLDRPNRIEDAVRNNQP